METRVFLVIIAVWNISISYLIWRIAREFKTLTHGLDKKNLNKTLGTLKEQDVKINQLEDKYKVCFQKSSLVKYNPYSELGGEQSFSLALLDDQNKGIVITSLHGRQSTRVYTKVIGSDKVKLSKEEEKAVKQASIKKS